MKVSVIIAFRNEVEKLSKCLQAVENQNFPRSEYEIICVDDGSTDGSSRIAKEKSDIYVKNSGSGQVVARNEGVLHASGKYLLFIDAHVFLPKHALQHFSKTLDTNSFLSGVFGRYHSLSTDDKNIIRDIRRLAVFNKGDEKRVLSLDDFTTLSLAVFFVKKSLFSDMQFPSSFGNSFGEDVFFQIKAHYYGHLFLYDPEVSVIHDANINMEDLIRKMILEIRGTENIIKQSSLDFPDLTLPRLAFFLSYPLLEFLLVVVAVLFRNYYFLIMILLFVIFRYRALVRVLMLNQYSFSLRIQSLLYLCTREVVQFFYLPIAVIKPSPHRNKYCKYFSKTVTSWSIKI